MMPYRLVYRQARQGLLVEGWHLRPTGQSLGSAYRSPPSLRFSARIAATIAAYRARPVLRTPTGGLRACPRVLRPADTSGAHRAPRGLRKIGQAAPHVCQPDARTDDPCQPDPDPKGRLDQGRQQQSHDKAGENAGDQGGGRPRWGIGQSRLQDGFGGSAPHSHCAKVEAVAARFRRAKPHDMRPSRVLWLAAGPCAATPKCFPRIRLLLAVCLVRCRRNSRDAMKSEARVPMGRESIGTAPVVRRCAQPFPQDYPQACGQLWGPINKPRC
jgi:hypothetical protein